MDPVLGEELKTCQETRNAADQYDVAVYKEDSTSAQITVSHVPRETARACWYFLQHDGEIFCKCDLE